MVNKRGWIRIVEASVAVLIILGVILSVSQIRKTATEKGLSGDITVLLDEIAKDATMRDKIIIDSPASSEAENMIKNFLAGEIKDPTINFSVAICPADSLCPLEPYPSDISGNLYAGSRIISTSLGNMGGGSKRVSLFLWRKA
jgi:hypothetical protein